MRGCENDGKVACNCESGRCFLEEDALWAQRNHEQARRGGGPFPNRAMLGMLDAERLQRKGDWITSLGVMGTRHIRCLMECD